MSVIVTNANMPPTCWNCDFIDGGDDCFFLCENAQIESRYENCPLKSVEGLIEKFKEKYPKNYCGEPEFGGMNCCFSLITVIQIIKEYCEVEDADSD